MLPQDRQTSRAESARAPNDARCAVSCWQSTSGKPRARKHRDQMYERDLRRVGLAREHRFTEKHPADRDTVETADQTAIAPRFHRMRVAAAMQLVVGVDDCRRDPGPALPTPRRGSTGFDHGAKRGVDANLPALLFDALAQVIAQSGTRRRTAPSADRGSTTARAGRRCTRERCRAGRPRANAQVSRPRLPPAGRSAPRAQSRSAERDHCVEARESRTDSAMAVGSSPTARGCGPAARRTDNCGNDLLPRPSRCPTPLPAARGPMAARCTSPITTRNGACPCTTIASSSSS